MLVTSIFSFSYNVFTGFLFQSHSKLELLVIGLNWLKHVIVQYSLAALLFNRVNPFPNKPWFLHVCSTSLLKTLQEKENLFVMSNFSFSPVFYSFGELPAIFIKYELVVCKLFQIGRA